MIPYVMLNAFKRLSHNFRTYLFIFLEILIGIFILNTFSIINFSINKKYDEMRDIAEHTILELNIDSKPGEYRYSELDRNPSVSGNIRPGITSADMSAGIPNMAGTINMNDMYNLGESLFAGREIPFTLNDYKAIKKLGKDISISFHLYRGLACSEKSSESQGNTRQFNIIFASDDFFRIKYPNSNIVKFEDYVLVGKNFQRILQEYDIQNPQAMPIAEIDTSSNRVILKNGNVVEMGAMEDYYGDAQYLEMSVPKLFLSSEDIISGNRKYDKVLLEDTIIIPMKFYFDFFLPSEAFNINISFKINDADNMQQIMNSIIDILSLAHGKEYTYRLDSEMEQFIRAVEEIQKTSQAITILTVFVLIIITLGLSGILLINIDRRKKNIAISMALGARKRQIFAELLLESSFVTAIPGALGAGMSLLFFKTGLIRFREFNIVINYWLMFASLFGSVIIGIIAMLVPLKRVKNIAPVKVLKSL